MYLTSLHSTLLNYKKKTLAISINRNKLCSMQELDAESECVVSRIRVAARPVGQARAAATIRPSTAAATARPALKAKTFPVVGQVSISPIFFDYDCENRSTVYYTKYHMSINVWNCSCLVYVCSISLKRWDSNLLFQKRSLAAFKTVNILSRNINGWQNLCYVAYKIKRKSTSIKNGLSVCLSRKENLVGEIDTGLLSHGGCFDPSVSDCKFGFIIPFKTSR